MADVYRHMRFCILALWIAAQAWLCGEEVTPPAQPSEGPGGSHYMHGTYHASGPFGSGAEAVWIFEPESPKPKTAPVIVFLHGYTGVDSRVYGGWIEHLVRRGNTVVYPVYQDTPVGQERYTRNALAGIKEAFRVLREEAGHVRPDAAERWAIVGHSLGCPIGANVASMAEKAGLPKPLAFLACNGGDANSLFKFLPGIMESPQHIPDMLLLVVIGEDDKFVGDIVGRQIFDGSTAVKPEHKNLIHLHSDAPGQPALQADHFAPLAMNGALANGAKLGGGERAATAESGNAQRSRLSRVKERAENVPGFGRSDALDFYGYWKWLDALTDAAFYGKNRNYALGDTSEQRFMGKWSNGTPVKPATVETGK